MHLWRLSIQIPASRTMLHPARDLPDSTVMGGPVHAVAFARSDKVLATGGETGLVRVWDITTGQIRWSRRASEHSLDVVDVSPDGKYVATGSESGASLWDARAGRVLRTLLALPRYPVYAIAFAPGGRTIAVSYGFSSGSMVKLFDVKTGALQRTCVEAAGAHIAQWVEANALVFTPDGKTLRGVRNKQGNDGKVFTWAVP